ncbi:MAG: hypothetical protein R3304_13535, partial [Longimicrobiales bacterium]|nr:hypothetical protein [Longimicrobiales bacterium]
GSVFADLVKALQPYLDDIVFVGGWVHALYLLEAEGRDAKTIGTYDIDITLPSVLAASDRPPLIDLVRSAGFEVQPYDRASGLLEIHRDSIPLDLLTEAPDPRRPMAIEGQELVVQGYPHQKMLYEQSRPMLVGGEVDESLDEKVQILVPRIPAYGLGKALSSASRTSPQKRAKDLVYLYELLNRERLRRDLLEGLPALEGEYPEPFAAGGDYLVDATSDERLLREVTRQVIEGTDFSVQDDTPVRAKVKATFRRFLSDIWNRN